MPLSTQLASRKHFSEKIFRDHGSLRWHCRCDKPDRDIADVAKELSMSTVRALQTFLCGLGGHELLRSFEPNRVCLRCTSCPYETRGWTLKEKSRQPQTAPHGLGATLIAQSLR